MKKDRWGNIRHFFFVHYFSLDNHESRNVQIIETHIKD